MDKVEVRAVIMFFCLEGKSTTEIKTRLDSTLGDSAPSKSMVCKWVSDFKRGRSSCSDEPRSERPVEVVTVDVVEKVHDLVLENRRTKVRDIAESVGISIERVWYILHEFGHEKALRAMGAAFDQKRQRKGIQKSATSMAKLHELRWELLPHPPFSPDLAPCDYHLFSNIKKWLGGKKFASNIALIDAVNRYFEGLDQ
uniref:Mos1 transposase HTH domain-containing protein n=1 Tax=Cacopsylla melanoneura TaxID=428564 RepID=A0A8D8YJ64_9HEMI